MPLPSIIRSAVVVAWRSLVAGTLLLPATSLAQESLPQGEPRAWADAAAQNEVDIIQQEGTLPLRYRVHKRDAKGDVTREIIETPQGSVARLVERNGQPLTPAEDAAERDRLNQLLVSPDEFLRHHKHDLAAHDYAIQLVKLMPSAMLYSYAAGQPQPANATSRQIVLDFRPSPDFHPSTMVANLLTGVEGRLWIDAEQRRVTRAEARVVHPVNFALGIVARIYPGGTVEFEQANVGAGHWVYSHLTEHLTVRELLFKTVPEEAEMNTSDFRVLPSPVDWQHAIHLLLAMPVATR